MDADEDPRVARSRHAAIDAARALLVEEGPAAVTHQRVAQRSGVGRATVYRHWPAPELLLQAVLVAADMPFFHNPTRPLKPWLHRELRSISDQLALAPVARFTTTLIQGAQWDAGTRQHLDDLVTAITRRLAAALAHEDPPAANDAADTAAQLLGPLLYRTLMQAQTPSDAFIEALIATALPTLPEVARINDPPDEAAVQTT